VRPVGSYCTDLSSLIGTLNCVTQTSTFVLIFQSRNVHLNNLSLDEVLR